MGTIVATDGGAMENEKNHGNKNNNTNKASCIFYNILIGTKCLRINILLKLIVFKWKMSSCS